MTQFRPTGLPLAAIITTAALLSAPLCKPAYADDQTRQVVVNYSDLDLTAKAGVDALRHRLIVASRDVCGDGTRELGETADMLACREMAMHDALRDLRLAVASAETRRSVAFAAK